MSGWQAPFRLPLPARNVYEGGICRPRAAPESRPSMASAHVLIGPLLRSARSKRDGDMRQRVAKTI
ncbi:hypothetical protein BOSEA31B_15017 [Hyphomicrobiales bacterium]|nr:hypothetical protein BOSEA31B_15017 [Hyphomicrobiales bacterium]CAH1701503.1 hypothetical protein BOSEA1005_21202 [Hyphomicrobiales bacterium]CAI0345460.1 hypothetical protein BO1005MUT1_390132 [Hyphomicrobiales bacterium]